MQPFFFFGQLTQSNTSELRIFFDLKEHYVLLVPHPDVLNDIFRCMRRIPKACKQSLKMLIIGQTVHDLEM